MEVLAYEFNQSHPNYADKYSFNNLYRGVTIFFCKNSYTLGMDLGWELRWSGKIIRSSAIGADNPTDTVYKHQLKAALSTLSYGWYVWPVDHFKLGLDWDVDVCSFTKKIGPDDSFGKQKREKLFDKRAFFVAGGTFFAEYQFKALRIRPYYQFDFFQGETNFGDNSYDFKINNFGIALFFGYEEKD